MLWVSVCLVLYKIYHRKWFLVVFVCERETEQHHAWHILYSGLVYKDEMWGIGDRLILNVALELGIDVRCWLIHSLLDRGILYTNSYIICCWERKYYHSKPFLSMLALWSLLNHHSILYDSMWNFGLWNCLRVLSSLIIL